jgi:sodium transport system permease protein
MQQSIVATMFGMVLGYIAVQTESIFPCMAFHAVHNALGIVAVQLVPSFVERYPDFAWFFEQIQDSAVGEPSLYAYGPVIILFSCLMSAFALRWFKGLPHQKSEEERLTDALKKQPVQVVG